MYPPQQYGNDQNGKQPNLQYPPNNQQGGYPQQPQQQYPQQQQQQYPQQQQQYPQQQQQYPNQQNYPPQQPYQQNFNNPQAFYQPNQDQMANDAIAKLKYAIDFHKIDLPELFCKFDRTSDAMLDIQEFGELLKKIDPTITASDICATFQKFDANKRNQVTFGDFCKNLGKYTEACNQVYDPNTMKQKSQSSDTALDKLKMAVRLYNINLYELFQKYDTQMNTSLNMHEFGTLLKRMEPNLTNYEIDLAFNKFDTDRSGSISFNEFEKQLFKYMDVPNPNVNPLAPQGQYPPQGQQQQAGQYPQQQGYQQPQQGQNPYPQQQYGQQQPPKPADNFYPQQQQGYQQQPQAQNVYPPRQI